MPTNNPSAEALKAAKAEYERELKQAWEWRDTLAFSAGEYIELLETALAAMTARAQAAEAALEEIDTHVTELCRVDAIDQASAELIQNIIAHVFEAATRQPDSGTDAEG